jgi:hypothetical protein
VDYCNKFCVKYICELSDFVGGRKVVREALQVDSLFI